MKTQVDHSTPSMLGPFLRLVLTIGAWDEAETADNLPSPGGEAQDFKADATREHQQAIQSPSHVSSRATTLGPFLTLLLTLHCASTWADSHWWPDSNVPRGAILAARYVSR
jgi:hypothetical protein